MHPAARALARRYPVALVTGASSGIGKEVAEALLSEGITIYGTSRNPQREGLNSEIRWIAFDGSTQAEIEAFISRNSELLTTVNLLVNNAGSSRFGEISRLDEGAIEAQFSLLLEAPVRLARAVLPSMREGGGGIVNVSSLATLFPIPHMSIYAAGKAGLSSFTQNLIMTERGGRVQVLDFQPGDFRTAFNRNQEPVHALSAGEKAVWTQIERHLMSGPPPEKAARDLLKALRSGRSGVVRSGGIFQAYIAPLGTRLLPRKTLLRLIRRYYHLSAV